MDHFQHWPTETLCRPSCARWGLLEAALTYASCWRVPVFPLVPRSKRPLVARGFYAATTDRETIQRWWEREPQANIGLPTGHRSGLVALDVDSRPDPATGLTGAEALQQLAALLGMPLPPTWTTRTGGGGRHLLYAAPTEPVRSATRLAGLPGLDVRGEGGYIVMPPSIHPSGSRYRWYGHASLARYPLGLVRLVLPPTASPSRCRSSAALASRADWERIACALARRLAVVGKRNSLGYWLACRLASSNMSFPQAAAMMRLYAQQVPQDHVHPPYTEQEALASLRSAFARLHR